MISDVTTTLCATINITLPTHTWYYLLSLSVRRGTLPVTILQTLIEQAWETEKTEHADDASSSDDVSSSDVVSTSTGSLA